MPVQTQPVPLTSKPAAADDVHISRMEAWALVGSQPLAQLSNMALLPSLGAMRTDLGLSYGELGIVVAAFGLARLVVDLPAGVLARRWNPRGVLLTAFALSTVASALGLFASNAWQISGVRLLIGVASSVAQAMILAWLVGGAGRVARGRVMARSEAFFSLVGLVIPSLSGLLAGPFGWRVAFLLGALAAALGFAAILSLTRPAGAARSVGQDANAPTPVSQEETSSVVAATSQPAATPSPVSAAAATNSTETALAHPAPSSIAAAATSATEPKPTRPDASSIAAAPGSATEPKPARPDASSIAAAPGSATEPKPARAAPSGIAAWRELRLGGHVLLGAYIATFVIFFCRNGLLNAVLPVMGADRFGIQPSEIGLLFSAMNALSIAVVLLGGRAGDRFGRYRLLAPGLALLLICQLLLFVVQDAASYVVVGLLQALSFFVNPIPPVLLGDALPPRARPQAIAVYRAASDLALLSAPAVMGAALQAGRFPAAELASVAVIAIALATLIAISVGRSSKRVLESSP